MKSECSRQIKVESTVSGNRELGNSDQTLAKKRKKKRKKLKGLDKI